ncbi:MAG TPA: hypothetical protein DDY89_11720, partial [Lysinibacillus sp.]|nr:hypothetical protein [Lysinibacillus sp.]
NYNCPSSIDSVYRWRIFIKDFLDGCSAVSDLVRFDGINYSTWYKNFNNNFLSIVQEAYQNLAICDSEKRGFSEISKMISPRGTAKQDITVYNMPDKINLVSVNTIHSVKGQAFDSVMVVSSLK